MAWTFYGRSEELRHLLQMIERRRWFFARITGRRRIGKTTLIQQAIQAAGANRPVFYVQIPDSGPAGVLSAIADACETFAIAVDAFPRPRTLGEFARFVGDLARSGFLVVLDEFQYFNREQLRPFCSFLQSEVDALSSQAERVPGGLFVLGSVHADLIAILEDRSAPLYNRTTDELVLRHLDIASIQSILRTHADTDPHRLLFLWTLFEGVPKFYRDCYEQGVLAHDRQSLLRRIFFESSSPLKTEAENWFLRELRGQYSVILKFVARHAGCLHNELVAAIEDYSGETRQQVGAYLKILSERHQLIEKKLPIFASEKARRNRYYLSDNFLTAWLAALAGPVAAINFRPLNLLLTEADQRLRDVEGKAFEKLVGQLYEERSRKGLGDFALTDRVRGFWDRNDTEIDLVAINESERILRFGSCKRSAEQLVPDLPIFEGHVRRFLELFPAYVNWRVERVCLAPFIPKPIRRTLNGYGCLSEDLADLTSEFH